MATLYLRAVPEHLVREAKAAAARRGLTLTAFVTDALGQALGSEGPEQRGNSVNLEAEMAWYQSHKPELLRRYAGEYLAVVDRKVLDHDRAFDPLARRVFKRLGVRPVFMPRCVDGERVVSLPSPRVVRALVRKRGSRRVHQPSLG